MDFPGTEKYEVGKLTYMVRGDCGDDECAQFLKAVRIEIWDGKKWTWYKSGEWIPTGVVHYEKKGTQHDIVMDPPFYTNKVKIHMDRDHSNNEWFSGRYDWWIRKV